MFKADGNASCSPKKLLWMQQGNFRVRNGPKPIKVHAEPDRAFSQKKQNPIHAGCNRGFAALCRRETAAQIPQDKIQSSLLLGRARAMATQ
jgi:hypothetical protein